MTVQCMLLVNSLTLTVILESNRANTGSVGGNNMLIFNLLFLLVIVRS